MPDNLIICGGMDCSLCSVLETIQNIFNYLLGIGATVAVLAAVLSGLGYIGSLGNNVFLLKAKQSIKAILIGFIAVLVSFLVINSAYLMLGVTDGENWFQLDCAVNESLTGQSSSFPRQGELSDRKVEFTQSRSIFDSVNDTEKVTELELQALDAENIYADALKLEPGQTIVFITSGETLGNKDIEKYINDQGGFFSLESGDRSELSGVEEKIIIRREVDGLTILSGGGEPEILGEVDEGDRTGGVEAIEKAIKVLESDREQGSKIYVYNGKNQEEKVAFNESACTDSGGEITIFQNECLARKATCGKDNIACSGAENELMGCQCPEGSCLQNQRCVPIKKTTPDVPQGQDVDEDGVDDIYDRCSNTKKGDKANQDKNSADAGCACSQMTLKEINCPQNRCEGSFFVSYQSSGREQCNDGKRVDSSCKINSEYNQICAQSSSPTNSPVSGGSSPSGGGSSGGGGSSSGGGGSSGGGSSGGGSSGGGGGGGSPDSGQDQGTDPGPGPSTGPSTPQTPPMTMKEAFASGNGSPSDPFVMSDKAMQEAFTYNEETGKIDLDKNWESKLGVAGKDFHVKVPPKDKIVENIDKKKKEKGEKPLDDEKKEKLDKDKEAVQGADGTKVQGKDGKDKTVDKKEKDKKEGEKDPGKTEDTSLDGEDEVLRTRMAGDPNHKPKNAKEAEAEAKGLVKAEDGTFTKNKSATDYFTPEVATKLKNASDYAKERGYGVGLTSGFRTNSEQQNLWNNRSGVPVARPGTSNHEFGKAADVYLTNSSGQALPMNSQNRAILKDIMQTGGGLKNLPSEWWHFSTNGR